MKNTEKIQQINLSELKPFTNHPFKIRQDDEMAQITESIKEYGVITPALARPLPDGGYELISGHRRMASCRALGIDTMPVMVREMNDTEAVIAMADEKKIAFTPAVELSYLSIDEQKGLLDSMQRYDCTPSHAQAIQLKKLSQDGLLTKEKMNIILSELKPNQKEQYKFKREEIRKYFPKSYTDKQIYDDVFKALELLKRHRERNRDSR